MLHLYVSFFRIWKHIRLNDIYSIYFAFRPSTFQWRLLNKFLEKYWKVTSTITYFNISTPKQASRVISFKSVFCHVIMHEGPHLILGKMLYYRHKHSQMFCLFAWKLLLSFMNCNQNTFNFYQFNFVWDYIYAQQKNMFAVCQN